MKKIIFFTLFLFIFSLYANDYVNCLKKRNSFTVNVNSKPENYSVTFSYNTKLEAIMVDCINKYFPNQINPDDIIIGYASNYSTENNNFANVIKLFKGGYLIFLTSNHKDDSSYNPERVIVHELSHVYCTKNGDNDISHTSSLWVENYNRILKMGLDIHNR